MACAERNRRLSQDSYVELARSATWPRGWQRRRDAERRHGAANARAVAGERRRVQRKQHRRLQTGPTAKGARHAASLAADEAHGTKQAHGRRLGEEGIGGTQSERCRAERQRLGHAIVLLLPMLSLLAACVSEHRRGVARVVAQLQGALPWRSRGGGRSGAVAPAW